MDKGQLLTILYVEDEQDLREVLAMDMESSLPVKVVECESTEEAMEKLREDTEQLIAMVICDYNLPGQNGDALYQHIRAKYPSIPFVLHTSTFPNDISAFNSLEQDNPHNKFVQKPEFFGIIHAIQKFLEIKPESKQPEYCKVAAKRFLMFNTIRYDIYLRLAGNKYIKIINKNELYMAETINKYCDKGCEFLYLKGEDYGPFLRLFTNMVKDRLIRNNLPPAEQLSFELDCAMVLHDHLASFDLCEEVMETAKVMTNSNLDLIKKDPQLSAIIETMTNREGYHLEHSLLISYISLAIATKMGWTSELTLAKLSLAAITHDISLDTDSTVRNHDIIPNDINNSHWRIQQQINHHPENGAERLSSSSSIPDDVCNIIRCHHETGDGKGYPRNLPPSHVPPLAAILIVAEAFSSKIISAGTTWKDMDHAKVAIDIQSRFSSGTFIKPAEGLTNVFGKK
jgi:response regulator RpfG family c-di-GMP phosphodiesterase